MSKVLGLDVGDVRVGIAIGETTTGIASPFKTVVRANGKAEREILNLIDEQGITTLVVGLPLGALGQRTIQCEKVERFSGRLKKRRSIELVYEDEHLTSVEAEQHLRNAGRRSWRRSARQKGMLDAMAASIILQQFLDRTRLKESESK
jgi:putative holliday junction resolvase